MDFQGGIYYDGGMREPRGRFLPAVLLIIAAALAGPGGAGLWAVEKPLNLARKALDIASYEDALRALNQALADDPETKGVRGLKGYAFSKLGQPDQALGELAKERERFPKNEDGWTLATAVLYEKGDLGGAEELARRYMAIFEEDVKERIESKNVGRVAKKAPNGGLPSFVLGLIAKTRGRPEEAEQRFREALKLGYDANACRAQSAMAALGARDFAGALKRALETRDPALNEGGELLTLEALALLGLGQRVDGLALLSSAADAEPFESWSLRNYGIGLLESGKHGEAAAVLSTLLKLYPADFQARELFDAAASRKTPAPGSSILELESDFHEFNKAIYRYSFNQEPDNLASSVNFGALELIRLGELDSAAGLLERFIELYSLSPTLEYNLAQIYNSRNARINCLRHAWKAIKLQPDFRDAWDLAANALFRLNEFSGAIRLYRKAVVELDPADSEARYNLGCAQFGAGDFYGAELSFRDAIALEASARPDAKREAPETKGNALDVHVQVRVHPISIPAYMNLAKLYTESGRAEQAIDCLNLAISLDPGTSEAYFELGRLHWEKNETEAAAECFKKYVELGGTEEKTRPYLIRKPPRYC